MIVATAVITSSSTPLQAQFCKTDLSGEWEITASHPNYSGTAQLKVGGTTFTGDFRRATNGNTLSITSGKCPGAPYDMYFFYQPSLYRRDDQCRWNTISGGRVGSSTSQTVVSWTGKRTAGDGPPKIEAVVNAASGTRGT